MEDEKKEIERLTEAIVSGEIEFPYQSLYISQPSSLFENLVKFSGNPISGNRYHLHSYYPRRGLYLPPKFRKEFVIILGTREQYFEMDVLSDYFVESVRLMARRNEQKHTPLEAWKDRDIARKIAEVVVQFEEITPEKLRHALYHIIPETKIFRPTWAKTLLDIVLGKELSRSGRVKWLDISAGWGDRLLTAMSINAEYLGFDPNLKLKEGHDSMIKMFGDPQRQKVVYEAFEKSEASSSFGNVDIVLTSPPYFNTEIYDDGTDQSVLSYPTFEEWIIRFLFASLIKVWKLLKPGGFLILHVGDTRTARMCEPMNIFIDKYLPFSSFERIICF